MALASRSSRNLTGVEEKIQDRAELAQVQRQARKVYIESLIAAAILTLLALVIPV